VWLLCGSKRSKAGKTCSLIESRKLNQLNQHNQLINSKFDCISGGQVLKWAVISMAIIQMVVDSFK
jgi:hypothetical protein